MHHFRYSGKRLQCEGVPIDALVERFGTPLYIYSQATLTNHFQRLDSALGEIDRLICFAVKSNSNLSVLRTLARLGAGFDIVSVGELQRVLEAGGQADRCVFAGVGKTTAEIDYALREGVYSFNVESQAELERINEVAGRLGKAAAVAVRVNPNVAAGTHKKITTGTYENKFGVAFETIEQLYSRAARMKQLRLRGVQMHIGSQITSVKPFEAAVRKVAPLALRLKAKHGIEFFSIGGGLGIVYDPALASGNAAWWQGQPGSKMLTPETYAETLLPILRPLGLRVLLEPGRFISGNAGILVTRIEYVKQTGSKNFLIVDAAMNDLIRPAFYDAYHEVVPLNRRSGPLVKSDVVGPICESGDYFCHDRPLPRLKQGDCIALMSAGAYASAMGSNYNTRPFPAEVLVNGQDAELVRERQAVKQIWAGEKVASWLK